MREEKSDVGAPSYDHLIDPAVVRELCGIAARAADNGQWHYALVAVYARLIHYDAAAYSSISQLTLRTSPAANDCLDQLRQLTWSSNGLPDVNAIFSLVSAAPLVLLLWVQEQANLSLCEHDAAALPEWVYGGESYCVTITEHDGISLGLPKAQRSYFISRSCAQRSSAAVANQHCAPEYWLRHWVVVPVVPDLSKMTRSAFLGTVEGGMYGSCADIAERSDRKMGIYLAEFAVAPEFDSEWIENTGSDGRRVVGWRARGLVNEQDLTVAAIAHLDAARKHAADVVVFPELTITESMRTAISDWLHANDQIEGHGHGFAFVVCGSFHVKGRARGAGTVNAAVVLDRQGNQVKLKCGSESRPLVQEKHTSVDFLEREGLYEANDKGTELVLAATPLGIHGIAICLDLAQVNLGDRVSWAMLPVRWLWSPSLSPKVSGHIDRAKELCIMRSLTVACANQAQAKFGGDFGNINTSAGQSFLFHTAGRNFKNASGTSIDSGGYLFHAPILTSVPDTELGIRG